MKTEDVLLAAEAWATEVVPELSSYPMAPKDIGKALPLVFSEPQDDRVSVADDDFPIAYQQTLMRVWTITLRILVDPAEAWTATQTLAGYVDDLGAALRAPSHNLGGRVESVLPTYTADYDPPEVQTNDGTRARQVTMTITIGEQVGGV